ncbi:hypothetical protein [Saccharopolyspora sp. NPDC002686]|uniref:hypothetical protein n=1 Tax=Saccharopolyspora sp. NPDC002686 TaxID=3154541 RepID=UPI00331F1108
MNDSNGTRDVDLVRAQLHRLVDDVEPKPDALPKMLASARRRQKSPRRPWFAAIGLVAAAAVALLVAVLVLPGQQTTQVSAHPNSYLAAPEPGVIASFDIFSGRQNGVLSDDVTGAHPAVLATDRNRVLALTSTADGERLVEVVPGGEQRVLPVRIGDARLLTAGGGKIAYRDGDAVVVLRGEQQQRIALPAGTRVDDLALSDDGRLALVAAEPGRDQAGVLVLAPGATSLDGRVEVVPDGCGPVAVTWTGRDIAALESPTCDAGQARVATFDANGRKLGAGVPFHAPELAAGAARLSADPLGRFLVSTSGHGQWLVDGSEVRPIPPACSADGVCADGPGTFWS